MKKTIFYISLVLLIIILVNIIQILATDFQRLTEYGFGYLSGKFILLILFGAIVFFTRKHNALDNNE